jgi:hypothetical protein
MPMLSNHQDQLRFIDFMSDLDTNLLYPMELFVDELSACAISVNIDLDNKVLLVGTHRVYMASAEWGIDGIFAPHVLEHILTDLGIAITSNEATISNRYKDRLSQLKNIWKLN